MKSQYQTLQILLHALLLLSMADLALGNTTFNCPPNCSCDGDLRTSIAVDCHGRPDVDRDQLSDQLDSLLSNNITYYRLWSLSITNTTLTDVPRSVCQLTSLRQLYLSRNQLTRLRDNCFTHLQHLTHLSANGNKIQKLQDGLFDGLLKLDTLNFWDNRISEIGLHVFSNQSDMINLRHVDLSHNYLTNVEPWPLVRGKLGTAESKVEIRFHGNRISTFTNEMGWRINCSAQPGYVYVDLSYNNIRHISDMLRGWNVPSFFCIFRFFQGYTSVDFEFAARTFACDCIDFPLYAAIETFYPFYGLLRQCHCSIDSPFYFTEITKVPPDQFVCEVTERCPPGCRCVHRPKNYTLHIYCSDRNLSFLPLELPKLPKSYTKYKLDFSNNRLLRRLEHRPYFISTSILDVSNCDIDDIPLSVWKDISAMKRVLMNGNSLKSLPQAVTTVPLRALLSLDRNPWACSCENRWMSEWLRSLNHSLMNVGAVLCGSPERLRGKNIIKISEDEFCNDPVSAEKKRSLIINVSSVVSVVVFLIILVFICFIVYRLRIKLYTRFKFHPFDRDECDGEDMDFDVFLSSSSDDNLPHGNGIRVQLEQRGYRVCYPPRDFPAGQTICENIYNAVVRSKRTVCLLTSHFLQRLGHLTLLLIFFHSTLYPLHDCHVQCTFTACTRTSTEVHIGTAKICKQTNNQSINLVTQTYEIVVGFAGELFN